MFEQFFKTQLEDSGWKLSHFRSVQEILSPFILSMNGLNGCTVCKLEQKNYPIDCKILQKMEKRPRHTKETEAARDPRMTAVN